MPDLRLENVHLTFPSGAARIVTLSDLTVDLKAGQFNVIAGPSGSGKTSLLSILGALLRPDRGVVAIGGQDITRLDGRKLDHYRRHDIGYIFQSFRLMRALSALDNVLISLEVRRAENRETHAAMALERAGIAHKAHLTPDQLSGGEQQRVAIARAIAHGPRIVLADEPTASLDSANRTQIVQLLRDLAHEKSRIVIAVSHDARLIDQADRVLRLEDGKLIGDELCPVL